MGCKMRPLFLLFVIFFFFCTSAFAEISRIDPLLSPMIKRPGARLKGKAGTGEKITVIVRFKGDLDNVIALGGIVRSILGDVATVEIPAFQLQSVAALPNVIYIEAPRKLKKRLDASVPATGADQLRSGAPPNWTGNTGRNVVVGIIDSGIDLTHPDFKDKNGKTRVRFLWDQNMAGTPPSGFNFDYGKECTNAAIDSGTCGSLDEDGHGTHVAGIAAGNGSATGNGQQAFRFIGMAPEADLIIVRLNDAEALSTSVLDGIKYIQTRAKELDRPSVINLSLGEHSGPQTGRQTLSGPWITPPARDGSSWRRPAMRGSCRSMSAERCLKEGLT